MLGALTVVAIPMASAGDGVSVAGQCWNADGSDGGGDWIEIDSDSTDVVPNALSGAGIVEALTLFGTQTAIDGQPGTACKAVDCNTGCTAGVNERYDFLMVEVRAGGNSAQVCYASQDGEPASASTTKGCPTRPTGPA